MNPSQFLKIISLINFYVNEKITAKYFILPPLDYSYDVISFKFRKTFLKLDSTNRTISLFGYDNFSNIFYSGYWDYNTLPIYKHYQSASAIAPLSAGQLGPLEFLCSTALLIETATTGTSSSRAMAFKDREISENFLLSILGSYMATH